MDESALLLMGIEVSVALAGFAGVVATFQFRNQAKVGRGDMVGLTMLVSTSLMVALFCALPLILAVFQLAATTVWSVSSALAASYILYSMYYVHRNMTPVPMRARTRVLFGTFQGVALLVAVLNVLNVANLGFHREPGPHVVSLAWGLSLVAYMFVRLLLRPLWRSVHEQEAHGSGIG